MIDKTNTDISAYCGDAKETNALAGTNSPTEPNGDNSVSAHTPGPWVYQEKSDAYTHIVRADDRFLCQLAQDTSGRAEADARLIAAAPDLLTALIECAIRCRYDGDLFDNQGNEIRRDASWRAMELAQDAIRKATGATP